MNNWHIDISVFYVQQNIFKQKLSWRENVNKQKLSLLLKEQTSRPTWNKLSHN